MTELDKQGLVDKIIGEHFADDSNTLFRARILISSWLLFVFALIFFGAITAFLPMKVEARLSGLALSSTIVLLLIVLLSTFKRSGNHFLFAHFSIAIGFIGITLSVLMASSATQAPSVGLFYIIPLLAVFFLGWFKAIIWVAITVLMLFLLFLLEKLKFPFFLGFYDEAFSLATNLSSMFLGMLGVLGMVITYEISNKKLRIERDREYKFLEYLARHDALTGLANRAFFEENIEHAVENLGLEDHGDKLALIYIDLDGFKPVNDQHGHNAGDEVLKVIAKRIVGVLGSEEGAEGFAARHGGDEFIVLLRGIKNKQEAVDFALHLKSLIFAPIMFEHKKLQVDSSIGLAMFPKDAQDISTLIRHADMAMYHAKTHKLGCVLYEDVPML